MGWPQNAHVRVCIPCVCMCLCILIHQATSFQTIYIKSRAGEVLQSKTELLAEGGG